MIDLDLFAGPGGWSTGARELGIIDVGIELDAAACATRQAAGHKTIRANVAAFPTARLAGQVRGLIGSPPCVAFSAAGTRGGGGVTSILADAVTDALAGEPTRAARRREMARELRVSNWPPVKPPPKWDRKKERAWKAKLLARKGNPAALRRAITAAPAGRHLTRAQRSARIWTAVRSASLVIEPARFAAACQPEWIALEQVPEVLPVWQRYAGELAAMGYSTWTGVLNAADVGVPQTRERAILIASRVRKVARPEPTHYDARKGFQLWGTPWVSMAEALGWGATGRPVPTVTAGGTATGGAEPFGHRGRDLLEAERAAGEWTLRTGNNSMKHSRSGSRAGDGGVVAYERGTDQPAPTLDTMVGSKWVLHTNRDQRPDGSRQTADPTTAPAPALTSKSGGQWVVRTTFGEPQQHSPDFDPFARPSRAVVTKTGDWTLTRPRHKDRDKGER